MNSDLTKLSKTISHALRHEPNVYGLNLDRQGWVNLSDLIESLQNKFIGWKDINRDEIVSMITSSKKKRFEIVENKIRAYYGHSMSGKIMKHPAIPPVILYHGTTANRIEGIRNEGLLPMSRQYVHLSEDVEMAKIVAKRRSDEIYVLIIRALTAYNTGVNFYKEENNVWLSEGIPVNFLNFDDEVN